MAQQNITIGTADAKSGDTLFSAFTKSQANFTELYGLHFDGNLVDVYQESDFQTQDATTITIESGMSYFIRNPVTTTKNFIMAGGSISSILTDIPFLTTTAAGVMFTASQNTAVITNIRVSCPNAVAFQVVGDGTLGSIAAFTVNVVAVDACTGAANAIDGGIMIFNTILFLGSFLTSPVTLSGSGAQIQSLDKVTLIGVASGIAGFDMGTTVNTEIELLNFRVFGDPAGFAIKGLANAGNIATGGSIMVIGGSFAGFTSPLSGVQVNDIRSDYRDNTGLSDSRNAVDAYMTGGSETITTGSAGDWQEIGVPSTATWASTVSDRFTVSSGGVITYIGESDLEVSMNGRATVEKVGGGSNILEVRFAINWDGTASDSGLERSRAQTQNTDPTTVPIGALALLTTNDNLRAIFSNTDGTSNIVASVASLEVTG